MNPKLSNYFIIGLTVLFFILGFNALQEARPAHKNERIYKEFKKYCPYYLEKRIGGFSILSKEDKIKEKPPITEVFSRLEQLEQGWGMEHLKIEDNLLIVLDNNKTKIGNIKIQTPKEKLWIQTFFNIK
jgi:hypothetical protein